MKLHTYWNDCLAKFYRGTMDIESLVYDPLPIPLTNIIIRHTKESLDLVTLEDS